MICIYFEIPFKKDFIKKVLEDQLKRIKKDYVSSSQYAGILDTLGIKTSYFDLENISFLKKLQLPILLVINNNPLIIWNKVDSKLLVSDPRASQKLIDFDEFVLVNKGKKIYGLTFEKTIYSLRSRFSLNGLSHQF